MARGLVAVGVPSNLEEQTFTYKNGDKAGQEGKELQFVMSHPATAMSGAVQCVTKSPDVMAAVRAANEAQESVQIAFIPDVVNYTKDGEDRHFFKLKAVAVVG